MTGGHDDGRPGHAGAALVDLDRGVASRPGDGLAVLDRHVALGVHELVVALLTQQAVGAGPAVEGVVAGAADQHVVAVAPVDLVVASEAADQVGRGAADEDVRTVRPEHGALVLEHHARLGGGGIGLREHATRIGRVRRLSLVRRRVLGGAHGALRRRGVHDGGCRGRRRRGAVSGRRRITALHLRLGGPLVGHGRRRCVGGGLLGRGGRRLAGRRDRHGRRLRRRGLHGHRLRRSAARRAPAPPERPRPREAPPRAASRRRRARRVRRARRTRSPRGQHGAGELAFSSSLVECD